MLKKLRLKFIAINMTIVTIMLCLIFTLLYISTSRNQERESIQMMRSIAMNPMRIVPPDENKEDIRLPYFSIMVNKDGETIAEGGGFFDLSDKEMLREILEQTYEFQGDNGILEAYNLRFLYTETPMGTCYVFTDITIERAMLLNLIRTFLLIGCIAFLAFLCISVFLARWAIKPVEIVWQQQKQFVADASHELKTPLTVIMTDAELLHAPDCTEEERTLLSGGVLTVAKQMRDLVENLLELARIDNGSVKESMQQISLSEITEETAMLFEPVFFEKNMPFSYEIEPNLLLNGNPTHLKQLSTILLDNASKYASPGGITNLSLKAISSKKYLLTITNQGDPISEEDLKHLFERFYRADKARTGGKSYGLGLSIAESIVSEHHGKIRAESVNGYNTFYVELPKS